MNLGQITNTVVYKVEVFTETPDYSLNNYLNELGTSGWFLHSIFEHKMFVYTDDVDYKTEVTTYRCIWQKITQNVSGLIAK